MDELLILGCFINKRCRHGYVLRTFIFKGVRWPGTISLKFKLLGLVVIHLEVAVFVR